ncbi:MAG: hypothetical protein ACPG1A_08565 [Halioglobus sp.]
MQWELMLPVALLVVAMIWSAFAPGGRHLVFKQLELALKNIESAENRAKFNEQELQAAREREQASRHKAEALRNRVDDIEQWLVTAGIDPQLFCDAESAVFTRRALDLYAARIRDALVKQSWTLADLKKLDDPAVQKYVSSLPGAEAEQQHRFVEQICARASRGTLQ